MKYEVARKIRTFALMDHLSCYRKIKELNVRVQIELSTYDFALAGMTNYSNIIYEQLKNDLKGKKSS